MNPELRRYAWLELGWYRLVIVPLVLGALVAIPMLSGRAWATPVAWGALSVFGVLTIGWGSMRALASVLGEVRDRTWDFQRMSALTPASLALGKVFGAPIFQWYIGAWCLAIFTVVARLAGDSTAVPALIATVASAVTLHALGVAASAASARVALGDRARRFGGIVLLLGIFNMVPVAALIGWDTGDTLASVRWWGIGIAQAVFVAASTVLLALWALVAAWRAMMRELREPAVPWAWPAFAASVSLWWSGLSTPTTDRPSLALVLAAACGVLAVGTYVGGLHDPVTPRNRARMALAWRHGRALSHPRWPPWALNAALTLALGGAAFVLAGPASVQRLALFALPFALMAVRDVAVVSSFALSSRARAPVSRAVFYIALADLLLPALATVAGSGGLARVFFPMWGVFGNPRWTAAAMAVHAALALGALACCLAVGVSRPGRRRADK